MLLRLKKIITRMIFSLSIWEIVIQIQLYFKPQEKKKEKKKKERKKENYNSMCILKIFALVILMKY